MVVPARGRALGQPGAAARLLEEERVCVLSVAHLSGVPTVLSCRCVSCVQRDCCMAGLGASVPCEQLLQLLCFEPCLMKPGARRLFHLPSTLQWQSDVPVELGTPTPTRRPQGDTAGQPGRLGVALGVHSALPLEERDSRETWPSLSFYRVMAVSRGRG